MQPTMTEAEVAELEWRLDDCECYLEYGSGESTLQAALLGVPTMVTVESDYAWFRANVAADKFVAEGMAAGRIIPFFPCFGPTKEWGFPAGDTHKHLWPAYPLYPLAGAMDDADLVLVDGRFRVACVLACLLTFDDECAILVHDYKPRGYYHVVEKYANVLDQVDSMAVLGAKDGLDRFGAMEDLRRYQYDPR